jgi:hypothetical protein
LRFAFLAVFYTAWPNVLAARRLNGSPNNNGGAGFVVKSAASCHAAYQAEYWTLLFVKIIVFNWKYRGSWQNARSNIKILPFTCCV